MIHSLKTTWFILFFINSVAFAQKSDSVDITLEADIHSPETYLDYLKEKHLGFKRVFQDSLKGKKHTIFLKSDDTYDYKLIIEVHTKKGEIRVLELPFTNAFHLSEGIRKDLITCIDKKHLSFSLPVSGKSFTQSDVLEIPNKQSDQIFIYTFTSKNAGKTWLVSKEVK